MTVEHVEDAATERAIELARELPIALPPASQREEMRTAILAAAARRGARRESNVRRFAIAGGALLVAAAAIVAVVVRQPAVEPARIVPVVHRGTVHPTAGARFVATGTLPDEIVRLEDGSIAIDVDPLAPGERFRVVVGDGEVEVRGTAFEVDARADRLIAVRVKHGRVEVRPLGAPIVVLGAGESWQRAITASIPVPSPSPTPSPTPPAPAPHHVSLHPKPPAALALPTTRAPDAIAFDEAWSAMRTSQFAAAAIAFTRVVALAPDGALADDARFWTAVAHSRAGARDAAIAAFRDLVDRHPTSAHADEASVMLGWLLIETNAIDEAKRRFTAGAQATSPEVRDSARAGLDALDKP